MNYDWILSFIFIVLAFGGYTIGEMFQPESNTDLSDVDYGNYGSSGSLLGNGIASELLHDIADEPRIYTCNEVKQLYGDYSNAPKDIMIDFTPCIEIVTGKPYYQYEVDECEKDGGTFDYIHAVCVWVEITEGVTEKELEYYVDKLPQQNNTEVMRK